MKKISKWLLAIGLLLISGAAISQSTHTLLVGGACGMCEDRIEQIASFLPGVKNADYDLKSGVLTITSKNKNFDILSIHQALSQAGHDTDLIMSSEENYLSLDGCCHYRELGFSPQIESNLNPSESELNKLSQTITGTILESGPQNERVPLIGANIKWLGAPVGAVSDENGNFEIGRIKSTHFLVISYIGYASDTLNMSKTSSLEWMMSDDVVLSEVQVTHRRKSSEISFADPIQTIKISEEELCKAACCNLSESFETSPAIDVSFTDAVTGTRQIQMLGLAGKYVQITRELIPDIRGLATIHGLTYTPGAWIQSLQLSKGAGSVVNGHESLTGQINVELRKPQTKERFYLNLYGNEGGRYEGNLAVKHKFSENLSTAILLHGSTRDQRHDRNDDGFLDMPIGKDVLVINRWKYENRNGFQGQFGVKVSDIERTSGELRYDTHLDGHSSTIWGASNKTERYEAWMKIGKVFNETKNQSIGFQLSGIKHEQDLIFGRRDYISAHNGLFANLIFQTNFISPGHSYKVGASFVMDDIEEIVDLDFFERDEQTIGAFAEYTFKKDDHFTSVLGIRGDLHNDFGFMLTPRVHLRYAAAESTVFRIIAGRGWRSANILAENIGMFASSRNYNVISTEDDTPYGLKPEQAWNFGFNITQEVFLGQRSATITADYYYTLFEDQIVADWESDANGTVILSNQPDATAGQSIQTQIDIELFERFDMRAAYRYNFNEAEYGGTTETLPLTSFHRAFVNLAYETSNGWHFDLTVNWKGKQRLPGTDWLPVENQLEEFSPDFFLMNGQIRRVFNENFELYAGGENLLDFTQENPIINSDDPFGDHFDASLVWGPIFGRNIYAGLRYRFD